MLKTDEVITQIEKKLAERLDEVGQMVVSDTKAVTPVRTGRLRASITHQTDNANLTTAIGSNVHYSKYVEARKPFLKPTVDRDRQKIVQKFTNLF